MKQKISLIIFSCLLLSMRKDDNDKKTLLCKTWRQFAYKAFKDITPKIVSGQMSKVMTLKQDGTYEEEMFALKSSGKWVLNQEQTKIGIIINSINGETYNNQDTFLNNTDKVILKLTSDTLIFGAEAYYGPDKIYGHDDWYFVKAE